MATSRGESEGEEGHGGATETEQTDRHQIGGLRGIGGSIALATPRNGKATFTLAECSSVNFILLNISLY